MKSAPAASRSTLVGSSGTLDAKAETSTLAVSPGDCALSFVNVTEYAWACVPSMDDWKLLQIESRQMLTLSEPAPPRAWKRESAVSVRLV